MASLNCVLKRQKLEVAIDFHDQSYYGKLEQSARLVGRSGGEKWNDQSVSGGKFVCHQERTRTHFAEPCFFTRLPFFALA